VGDPRIWRRLETMRQLIAALAVVAVVLSTATIW